MTRQRGQAGASDYLIGADDEAETGTRKGIFYDKGLERPGYIAPPSDPLKWSLELRREMKEEIHELVTGALTSVGNDGSIEAGLAFIGGILNDMENRLWEHWAAYMPNERSTPIVNYPVDWDIKTDKERVEEAEAVLDLMNKLPGRLGKKEAAKRAYDKMFRGKVSDADLTKMKKEIEEAPYATADPDILKMAGERGYVGPQTASLALGLRRRVRSGPRRTSPSGRSDCQSTKRRGQRGGHGHP